MKNINDGVFSMENPVFPLPLDDYDEDDEWDDEDEFKYCGRKRRTTKKQEKENRNFDRLVKRFDKVVTYEDPESYVRCIAHHEKEMNRLVDTAIDKETPMIIAFDCCEKGCVVIVEHLGGYANWGLRDIEKNEKHDWFDATIRKGMRGYA